MPINVGALISTAAAVAGLMFGLVTLRLGLSSGLGLRPLRWFGCAALCAAVYSLGVVVTTLPFALEPRSIVARVAVSAASLLIGFWYVYAAAEGGRPLERWERIVIGGLVVIAGLWLVPGLCRSSRLVVRDVTWLGVTYTTTRPTAVGQATYVLMLVATILLAARFFVDWRRGQSAAFAHFLSVCVQLVAGVNDALAVSGRIDTPYLLDLGQIVVVLAIGSRLVTRFAINTYELERSGEQLRVAQAELVRRERLVALGELSAVVAHEVRNPLAVIFNALVSLRRQRPLGGETVALLDIVQEEAERLKRVVGELLDFARPHELSLDNVVPSHLVASAVAAATTGEHDPGHVRIHVEHDLPSLLCDEHMLRQALVNLVTNALQAEGRTAPVEVRVFAKGDPTSFVCFRVSDDGAGISSEVAKRLFTPFFTTRARGTGLGLAIVKRVVEAHGGEIQWEPAGERGATFTLAIPLTSGSTIRAVVDPPSVRDAG